MGVVGIARILQIWIACVWFFEGNHTGKQPTIHLGQNHMHCQITGRQTSVGFGPCGSGRGGQCHLKNRDAGDIQRRGAIFALAGKGCGIDDRIGCQSLQLLYEPFGGLGGFERGNKQAVDVKAPLFKGVKQRLYRTGVASA